MNFHLKLIKPNILKKFSVAFISLAIVAFDIKAASADFTNLEPCKESLVFQKRLMTLTKKLEKRSKLYVPNSQEANALLKQMDLAKSRFARYGASNLLCGKDGLPRIIANGQWDHANEFILPSLCFLYIAGWIGWVGRKYVHYASATENPFENEIIINVPVAVSFMRMGVLWPADALNEFKAGNLISSNDELGVSPR